MRTARSPFRALRYSMKTSMKMLPNGNYESVVDTIQHECKNKDWSIICVEYSWKPKKLLLKIESGDPYEDGFTMEEEVKFCPFCGYSP